MPLFDYQCEKCSYVKEEFVRRGGPLSHIDCPICKGRMKRIFSTGVVKSGEGTEYWSKSLGVNVDQIPEMKKLYPHHEYHPKTGDLLVKNPRHRDKLMKELGAAMVK